MSDIVYFPLALAMTLLLEGIVLLPLLIKGDKYLIGVFVLVNVITNVTLNFALGLLECFPVDVSAIDVVYVIGECVAVAVEYLILKRVCRNKYLFLSLYSTYKHITRNISGHGHNLLAIQSVIHRNLKTDHLCLSMGK